MFDRIYHYEKPVGMTQHAIDVAESVARSLVQAIQHDLTHYADGLCEEFNMQYFLWA